MSELPMNLDSEFARRPIQEANVATQRQSRQSNLVNPILDSASVGDRRLLEEEAFRRLIAVERKRTERSKTPFVMMLLEYEKASNVDKMHRVLQSAANALIQASRDTDTIGWYERKRVIGAMFTELVIKDKGSITGTLMKRVSAALQGELAQEDFEQIKVTFHFFPDEWDHNRAGTPTNTALYPDLVEKGQSDKLRLVIKRALDLAVSVFIICLLAPLFLLVAAVIKLTSRGPILFRQQRVGQFGQCFTFLKFRSMYANNDSSVHKDFVTGLIKDQVSNGSGTESAKPVYKLTNDKRITPIGGFLRRTSLDELPQFFNVLRGDMSLVGPRPPIPYELAAYQTWHRRRILEVKPGITGLWQVTGRSTVRFDEMVRLDLRYATNWSPWLDIKILLLTPLAVIRGSGAY